MGSFNRSRELSILTCMDKHPSQNHLIATGGVDGILNIYDLRQEGVPVTIMEGHHGSTSKWFNLFTTGWIILRLTHFDNSYDPLMIGKKHIQALTSPPHLRQLTLTKSGGCSYHHTLRQVTGITMGQAQDEDVKPVAAFVVR